MESQNSPHRPHEDDLAYIKYSAKELLFVQGQKIDHLADQIHDIRLNMVVRAELTSARRWAVGAGIAAVSSFFALLRALGV
jgi:hypothetical protein